MHSRTIDTPPAEMRHLVPKLTRLIEELVRLRAEAAAAVAAVDEAERAVKAAETPTGRLPPTSRGVSAGRSQSRRP